MAGATSRAPHESGRGGTAQDDLEPNIARDVQDTAPGDDKISQKRADYAPVGADPSPTLKGTLKRLVKEISEDNLTDWAAALTYYLVLAIFPAIIAMISIVGLVFDPQQITDALTSILDTIAPGSAANTFSGVIDNLANNRQSAGLGLIVGVLAALWSASGYVGAFTRAANVVWETPEGRPFWKLKPLQLLLTLIGVPFIALIAMSVVLSGPIVQAVAAPLGLGDTAVTVWRYAKWPVLMLIVAIMVAV